MNQVVNSEPGDISQDAPNTIDNTTYPDQIN